MVPIPYHLLLTFRGYLKLDPEFISLDNVNLLIFRGRSRGKLRFLMLSRSTHCPPCCGTAFFVSGECRTLTWEIWHELFRLEVVKLDGAARGHDQLRGLALHVTSLWV